MHCALLLAALPATLGAPSCPVTETLGTYGFGRAAAIAAAGEAAGVWMSPTVRSGIAGDDLEVTYVPSLAATGADRMVYTALRDAVDDPRAECEQVGSDGVTHHVWVSYRCTGGAAFDYTLLVR